MTYVPDILVWSFIASVATIVVLVWIFSDDDLD